MELTKPLLLKSIPDIDQTVRTTSCKSVVLIVKSNGVYLEKNRIFTLSLYTCIEKNTDNRQSYKSSSLLPAFVRIETYWKYFFNTILFKSVTFKCILLLLYFWTGVQILYSYPTYHRKEAAFQKRPICANCNMLTD